MCLWLVNHAFFLHDDLSLDRVCSLSRYARVVTRPYYRLRVYLRRLARLLLPCQHVGYPLRLLLLLLLLLHPAGAVWNSPFTARMYARWLTASYDMVIQTDSTRYSLW